MCQGLRASPQLGRQSGQQESEGARIPSSSPSAVGESGCLWVGGRDSQVAQASGSSDEGQRPVLCARVCRARVMHPGTPGSFRGREAALTSSGLSPVQEGPPNPAFWPKVPPDMGRRVQAVQAGT